MKLERIQLRRTKGWRLPGNTIVVARPGKWGNPFRVGDWFRWTAAGFEKAARPGQSGFVQIETPAMAVKWFTRWLDGGALDVAPLRGKNLACWCPPGRPCHADVLSQRANEDEPAQPDGP